MSRFDFKGMSQEQVDYSTSFRNQFQKIEAEIASTDTPPLHPRYTALALTALEEANMWLNKAISREEGA